VHVPLIKIRECTLGYCTIQHYLSVNLAPLSLQSLEVFCEARVRLSTVAYGFSVVIIVPEGHYLWLSGLLGASALICLSVICLSVCRLSVGRVSVDLIGWPI
jgi:hypothetical protein